MDYTKGSLREQIRAVRDQHQINFDFAPLLQSKEFNDAKVIASYRSYGNEPDTTDINKAIIDSNRILLLPRLRGDAALDFVRWDGNTKSLRRNGRVEEPVGDPYLGPIDIFIIPSLAADRSGIRLGQGGGSYDRTLADRPGWRVTLLFESELLDQIPAEVHDQRIDAVLLPNQLVNI